MSIPSSPAPVSASSNAPRIIVIVAAGIIGLLFIGSLFETGLLATGSNAPSFTLQRANAPFNAVALSDLKGRVIVLDFWSTSCPPCLREIEHLKRFHDRYNAQNVSIVGISVGGESVADIADFAKERQVDYPLLVDASGAVGAAYKVSVLPTIYILDSQGRIAASHTGFWALDDLEAELKEVMNGK